MACGHFGDGVSCLRKFQYGTLVVAELVSLDLSGHSLVVVLASSRASIRRLQSFRAPPPAAGVRLRVGPPATDACAPAPVLPSVLTCAHGHDLPPLALSQQPSPPRAYFLCWLVWPWRASRR